MRFFFVVSYITSLKHQSWKRNAAVNEPTLFAYDSINVSYEGVENKFSTSLSLRLCTVTTSGSAPSSVPG